MTYQQQLADAACGGSRQMRKDGANALSEVTNHGTSAWSV